MLSKVPPEDKPVGLSLFADYCKDFLHKAPVPTTQKLPKALRSFFRSELSKEEVQEHMMTVHELKLTDEQRKFIQQSTVLQSASLTWKSIRVGRITASTVYDVLHTDQCHPSKSIIKKLCTEGPDLTHIESIKWGCDNEHHALATYKKSLELEHGEVTIEKSGLLIHEQYHFLGASPDGICQCSCHGKFLIEIKCPYRHKEHSSIDECINLDTSFCLNEKKVLKESHKYFSQVQMQMLVFGIKFCHFVVWGPKFCHGVVVNFDESFTENIPKLVDFHKKHIAHELVTREIEC